MVYQRRERCPFRAQRRRTTEGVHQPRRREESKTKRRRENCTKNILQAHRFENATICGRIRQPESLRTEIRDPPNRRGDGREGALSLRRPTTRNRRVAAGILVELGKLRLMRVVLNYNHRCKVRCCTRLTVFSVLRPIQPARVAEVADAGSPSHLRRGSRPTAAVQALPLTPPSCSSIVHL